MSKCPQHVVNRDVECPAQGEGRQRERGSRCSQCPRQRSQRQSGHIPRDRVPTFPETQHPHSRRHSTHIPGPEPGGSTPPSKSHSAPLSAPALAPCHRGTPKTQEKALRSSAAPCHPTAAQGRSQSCHSLCVPMSVLLPVHRHRHTSLTHPTHVPRTSSMYPTCIQHAHPSHLQHIQHNQHTSSMHLACHHDAVALGHVPVCAGTARCQGEGQHAQSCLMPGHGAVIARLGYEHGPQG